MKYFFLKNGQNSTPYLTPPHTANNTTIGSTNLDNMGEEVWNQRLQLVQEPADLEKEQDKEVNKLRRKHKQTLSRYNFIDLESLYIYVRDLHTRLISKIDDWTDILNTDDQGDPIYPKPGMPESRYAPESEYLTI